MGQYTLPYALDAWEHANYTLLPIGELGNTYDAISCVQLHGTLKTKNQLGLKNNNYYNKFLWLLGDEIWLCPNRLEIIFIITLFRYFYFVRSNEQ